MEGARSIFDRSEAVLDAGFHDFEAGFGDLEVVFRLASAEGDDDVSGVDAKDCAALPAEFAGHGRALGGATVLKGGGHFSGLGVGDAEEVVAVGGGFGVCEVSDDGHLGGPGVDGRAWGVADDGDSLDVEGDGLGSHDFEGLGLEGVEFFGAGGLGGGGLEGRG